MRFLPAALTIINILLGIMSLWLISIGRLNGILLIVPVAALLDFADGYIARGLNIESKAGCIMDSISDLICFVFAPCYYLLMAQEVGSRPSIFLAIASTLYLAGGITRLLRYTVYKLRGNDEPGVFVGCPVTACALVIVMAAGIYHKAAIEAVFVFLSACLMVVPVEYHSFSKIINDHRNSPFFFIYALLLLLSKLLGRNGQ